MTPPLASIILLTYKQEAFVEEALRSLLGQDWPNFEIIISDDASPDGTLPQAVAIVVTMLGLGIAAVLLDPKREQRSAHPPLLRN